MFGLLLLLETALDPYLLVAWDMKVGPCVEESLERFLVAMGVCWLPIMSNSCSLNVVGFFLADAALTFVLLVLAVNEAWPTWKAAILSVEFRVEF